MFVTVLMVIIVMIALSISIISINVSQVMIAENETKRLQAEMLALGAVARTFANKMSNSPATGTITRTQQLDNVTFTIVSNVDESQGTSNPAPLTIDVSY